MATTLEREYRKVRDGQNRWMMEGGRVQNPATYALAVARNEVALQQAEANDEIRFVWQEDVFYEPDGDCGIKEEEESHITDGSWIALQCYAEVPKKCPHCGQVLEDEWKWAEASLSGIVIDVDDKHNYRREVERELAMEAGVI